MSQPVSEMVVVIATIAIPVRRRCLAFTRVSDARRARESSPPSEWNFGRRGLPGSPRGSRSPNMRAPAKRYRTATLLEG